MKNRIALHALAVVFLSVFLLAEFACSLPNHGGSASISLSIARGQSRSLLANTEIKSFQITVSADNEVLNKLAFSETTISFDVEAGPDRVFLLEAFDTAGALGMLLYTGSTTATLVAGQTTELDITLVAATTTTTVAATTTTTVAAIPPAFFDDTWLSEVSGGNTGYVPSQSVSSDSSSKNIVLIYNNGYSTGLGSGVAMQTWTFTATAQQSGTISYSWTYSGDHAWSTATAALSAWTDTTNNPPPMELQSFVTTAGTFSYTGSSTLEVQAGQTYGFSVQGSNYDSTSRLYGTVTIQQIP